MNPADDRPSPDLASLLLGELSAADASALERALAADPSLRAEKERLEHAIAAIREAFPDEDRLADRRRSALVAEAERCAARRRPRFAFRPAAVAAAAALLAVAGTLATIDRGPPRTAGSTGVAVAPAPAATTPRDLATAEASALAATTNSASAAAVDRDDRALAALLVPVEERELSTVLPVGPVASSRVKPHVYRAVDASPDWSRARAAGFPGPATVATVRAPTTPGTASLATARSEEFRRWALPIGEAPLATTTVTGEVRAEPFLYTLPGVAGFPPAPVAGLPDGVSFDLGLDVFGTPTLDDLLAACRRRPEERPSAMHFRFWGDHGLRLTLLDPVETFGADVDTASWSLARRYLNEGHVPEKAQVRTEEFVNAFSPDVPPPAEGTFRLALELAEARPGASGDERWMLRVALRGREVAREARAPLRLTFVVDTSGSMKEGGRLELVKHALRLLAHQLDDRDALAIVAFSNDARMVLPTTNGAEKATIEGAIHSLAPDGGTNAEAGLLLGFAHAAEHRDAEASSRVVLLSDGVANVGETDRARLTDSVRRYLDEGIGLNTVGVGLGNHDDAFLEQLADHGDGLCRYVDSPAEAKRALVDGFVGAFQPIARDVKIRVEFDPAVVARYRPLGYENRAIADADFRNDAVDAGEVGAGHQVCALFEIEPTDAALAGDALAVPLAVARVRWLPPRGEGEGALEIGRAIDADARVAFDDASFGYRRATIVARFAELLRRSVHARDDSIDALIDEARRLAREAPDDREVAELATLIEKSRGLIVRHLPPSDPLARAVDALRRNAILRAELEELSRGADDPLLEELERENERLERLLRERLEERGG